MKSKSEIELGSQGIRGGANKYSKVGMCTIFATDKGQRRELEITIDSFTGAGNTYQRREKTLINIEYEGKMIFTGDIQKLVSLLNIKPTKD